MQASVCVVGGGPAGMMTGLLLARKGVDVVVLEKYPDFFRDFRGDTIHPSTLRIVDELGLLAPFLARPHQELREISVRFGGRTYPFGDFRRLPGPCTFLALMPQWDFLDFLATEARRFPNFRLLMETEAVDVVREGDAVVGVVARGPGGALTVRAPANVFADGRHSRMREALALRPVDLGAPMDVLWFRISREEGDPPEPFGIVEPGELLVLIPRGDYYQCGFIIPKGGIAKTQAAGIAALRARIGALAPFLAPRAGELRDFDDVHLLTVAVDRLRRWSGPGYVCIGDAAHAMSPVGGVGINLAIQDAVATGNLFPALDAVQRRRELPVRVTQALQVAIGNRVLAPLLGGGRLKTPLPLRVLAAIPPLRVVPAYLVGIGIRPEHLQKSNSKGRTRRSGA